MLMKQTNLFIFNCAIQDRVASRGNYSVIAWNMEMKLDVPEMDIVI